jgi:hypothetical protein
MFFRNYNFHLIIWQHFKPFQLVHFFDIKLHFFERLLLCQLLIDNILQIVHNRLLSVSKELFPPKLFLSWFITIILKFRAHWIFLLVKSFSHKDFLVNFNFWNFVTLLKLEVNFTNS